MTKKIGVKKITVRFSKQEMDIMGELCIFFRDREVSFNRAVMIMVGLIGNIAKNDFVEKDDLNDKDIG